MHTVVSGSSGEQGTPSRDDGAASAEGSTPRPDTREPSGARPAGRRALWLLVPFVLVVALDRVTKNWVQATIWDPPRVVVIVPGWLELTPVANRGIAFGMLQDAGGALALVAVIVLGLVAVRSWRQLLGASAFVRLCLGLIGAGAVGNVIDRAMYGYVTDFVHIPPIYLFQVFNVADAAISVGAVLLALALWLGDRRRPRV